MHVVRRRKGIDNLSMMWTSERLGHRGYHVPEVRGALQMSVQQRAGHVNCTGVLPVSCGMMHAYTHSLLGQLQASSEAPQPNYNQEDHRQAVLVHHRSLQRPV